MSIERRQRGLTLIELIVFIVIVGVALAGVLSVLNLTTRHGADPLVRKQALAIAEALLEEVMLQPFTWCDQDDANVATAMDYAGCAAAAENTLGPEGGEGRGSYDNVNDYNGLTTTTNIAGGGAAPYSATVTVANASFGPAAALVGDGAAGSAALLITVEVAAGGETIRLQGYRTRYAPNLAP